MEDKAFKQFFNAEAPQLEVIKIHEANEIVCTRCASINYIKAGFKNGKQRYKCRNCGKSFVTNPTIDRELKYPEVFDFKNDIWTAEQLGLNRAIHDSRKSSILNFGAIKQDWLKYYAKRFIQYSASNKEYATLQSHYMSTFKCFSVFISKGCFLGGISNVNRNLMIEYVSYISQKGLSPITRGKRLSALSLFFETGVNNEWFQVPPYLILKEDYPKRGKTLPRYIPEEVMQQLNQHFTALPEPIMRMTLVIQECGMRIGELCQLPLNCLKDDGKGQYRIQFMRWKMKTEESLPISLELAQVIKEQQQYIRENFQDNFEYLFCGRKASSIFQPDPKVISIDSFVSHLNRLAEEFDIKDNSGKRWHFQTHQFRHTVGTRMINNGVPQHIVQRYLGHESPTMTAVYAHIHDETLRKEIEKYHDTRVVNFQGETAELEETVLASGDDLEWFKKTVQARALEHGYCARPKLLGDCDIPGFDGCYNCPHWRTNKNFLPVLKDTLERTDNVLNKARNCGWELQVKKNEPVKTNLEKVIKSLEEAS